MDTSVPVLILQMSPGRLHHGTLGIVRSLGRLGVPVHLFRTGPWAPVTRSRYVTGSFPSRFVGASDDEALDALERVANSIGKRAILIPTDDVGSIFVNENASALKQHYVFPDQPCGLPRALASKKQMYGLCLQYGVPTPATDFPQSREAVVEFARNSVFPIAVKAIDAGRIPLAAGGQSVIIARNASELLEYYDRVEDPDTPNLMLQEYIPGGAESIWMFNGYFDAHSDCLVGFAGQKIRQNPPYTGATTLGVCVPNERVTSTTLHFMKALGYHGILDLGYRYDARDDCYKLLDVNPRVGATFRLFTATDGLDVVRAMYLDLTGQSVPQAVALRGRKWLVENQDIEAGVVYLRDRNLSVKQWVRSLRGVQETAWFARDDPVPFVLMCGGAVIRTIRRARAARNGASRQAQRA